MAPIIIEFGKDELFKKQPLCDFNRMGLRRKNPANCSLALKNVPISSNNIGCLNDHFSNFGKIMNIKCRYEGDPKAAILTFSSQAEANACYTSNKTVLNNRFIKISWHSNNSIDDKQENGQQHSVQNRLRMPQIVATNPNKVLNLVQPKADSKTEEANDNRAQKNVEAVKTEKNAQIVADIKASQEMLAAKVKRKKMQEKALKMSQNLRMRQQELLQKQLAHQKLLISKMEKTPAGSQREYLFKMLKKFQESIETTVKKVKAAQPVTTTKTTSAKTIKEGEQENRCHLLTRNNLINAGLETNFKTSKFQKYVVEHQSTRLLVSGYESDEENSVLTHFWQYGVILDYVSDPAIPSIVLNYKTRQEAELALWTGKNFQDRTLSVRWCNKTLLSGRSSTTTVSESDGDHLVHQEIMNEDDDMASDISEKAVLLIDDDEDEEEEKEYRSWRR